MYEEVPDYAYYSQSSFNLFLLTPKTTTNVSNDKKMEDWKILFEYCLFKESQVSVCSKAHDVTTCLNDVL